MCLFTAAAPADESDIEITTDFPSTLVPETTLDSRQNEVDSELLRGDEEATTEPSYVDGSIEAKGSESGETTSETATAKSESNEETTIEFEASSLATEKSSNVDETTKEEEIAQKLEIREQESDEASTTIQVPSTTEQPEDEQRKMSARAQVIQKITKMLRAYALRALLAVFTEAKKRQNLEAEDLHSSASQVMAATLPVAVAASGSDYDDGKIIVFDEIKQRHVSVDRKDYERAISRLQSQKFSVDYVSDEQFSSPTRFSSCVIDFYFFPVIFLLVTVGGARR